MTAMTTPGLHRQPLDPVLSGGQLARGDVPALLGYAARGPVGVPVRVSSLRQLEDVFGPAPAHGFLWHAAKGFFETGGRSAYVVRVATERARAAHRDQREGRLTWRATASFPWSMIDPRRLRGGERLEAAGWVQVFERQIHEHGPRTDEPGTWGNSLSVDVRRTARVRTSTLPEVVADGTASFLASLAGLEASSILELSQTDRDGVTRQLTALPAAVDADRRLVHWPAALDTLGLDLSRPVRIASVEFDIGVLHEGRLEQTFSGLAPHPGHSASITRTMELGCRALDLRPVVRRALGGGWVDEDPHGAAEVLGAVDWSDPFSWPLEGRFHLRGGAEGLEDVAAHTWLRVLDVVAGLPDAALVAAPDLVLSAAQPPIASSAPLSEPDCTDLAPTPLGQLRGRVTGADADGTEVPLVGVSIDVAGPGSVTRTGPDGGFELFALPPGLVTLRLRATGYEPLELLAQSSTFASAPPVEVSLTRITAPRPLPPEEILQVQRALADPSRVGPYRVALVDPPAPDSRLDELATWRSRLGDDARLGLFAPWLILPAPDGPDGPNGTMPCPPSGHVCGAFAAAEHASGIHRTGANLPLRYVEGTTLVIGDAEQAGLNPVGVNAIRAFAGRGIRVFGTRSLSSDPEWRFLTARRIVDAIEKTLERALHWMVFEPNTLVTRQAVALTAATLLGRLHRDGVLSGPVPEAAFSVKCDLENNPVEGRDAGRLVVDIGVAPTHPYEFVLFRLGHTYDALSVTENA